MIGQSAKARKGTAFSRIEEIFRIADDEWEASRSPSGLSTGEGLIFEVRDAVVEQGDNGPEVIDPGVDNKRRTFVESEFARALTVMSRPGNTLSGVMRDAWDGRDLASLTKNKPLRATGPHISIVGHITVDELQRKLDETSMANGYANRFLFTLARRARLLPHGGDLADEVVQELGARTRHAISKARNVSRVTMTSDARETWERIYPTLSAAKPGLLGAILARAEAQTVRLALTYALLDEKEHISVEHLNAALALWSYCEASALYIFRDVAGDPADVIHAALGRAGSVGMTRTEIRDLFGRHGKPHEVEAALTRLVAAGKAKVIREPTSGRPREVWKTIVSVATERVLPEG